MVSITKRLTRIFNRDHAHGSVQNGAESVTQHPNTISDQEITDLTVGNGDISDLSPRQLAVYHLAATALQLNGQEIFLSDELLRLSEESAAKTHIDLAIASADAITKEFMPWGQTVLYGDISGDPRIKSIADSDVYKNRYIKYLDDPKLDTVLTFGLNSDKLGSSVAALLWAMRQALRDNVNDVQKTLIIVKDIADVSGIIFAVIRESEIEKGVYDPEKGYGSGKDKRKFGWLEFSEYVSELVESISQTGELSDINLQIVAANRVIGAVHEGGLGSREENSASILNRFTIAQSKRVEFLKVLDASRQTSLEELVSLAGVSGALLYRYLNGSEQSLDGLPSNKPISTAFTRFRQ